MYTPPSSVQSRHLPPPCRVDISPFMQSISPSLQNIPPPPYLQSKHPASHRIEFMVSRMGSPSSSWSTVRIRANRQYRLTDGTVRIRAHRQYRLTDGTVRIRAHRHYRLTDGTVRIRAHRHYRLPDGTVRIKAHRHYRLTDGTVKERRRLTGLPRQLTSCDFLEKRIRQSQLFYLVKNYMKQIVYIFSKS